MRTKIFIFALAMMLNTCLLFALPFLKYLSQETGLRVVQYNNQQVRVLQVNLEQEKKKPKKLVKVKTLKPKLGKQKAEKSRFDLDLGLGTAGTGVALQGAATKNIIYEQHEVDGKPVRISGRDVEAPINFTEKDLTGKVELEVIIEANGRVSFVETRLETPLGYNLAKAASTAVKTWKFRAARIKKVPVRIRVIIPFVF